MKWVQMNSTKSNMGKWFPVNSRPLVLRDSGSTVWYVDFVWRDQRGNLLELEVSRSDQRGGEVHQCLLPDEIRPYYRGEWSDDPTLDRWLREAQGR